MGVRDDSSDVDLKTESGGEPDTNATRLNNSVALRPGCVARAFRLAFEVVMDTSVADARSSLGLLIPALRSDESLRCIRPESEESEAIVVGCWVAEQLIEVMDPWVGVADSRHSRDDYWRFTLMGIYFE